MDRKPLRDTLTDEDLIRMVRDGDADAFDVLFVRHHIGVYNFAYTMLGNTQAAEDILQECFVRLFTYATSIDTDRPLKPWLYRVTVNLSYDWSSERIAQPLDEILDWISKLAGAFPAPDHKAEEQETMKMVRDVVAQLPPLHRAVVVLFYMENLSIDEVSQVLDLPAGTVKSRLHYARGRLRKMLTQRQRPVPEMTYEFT